MNFDKAFDRLMISEGGYVDHPKDPGQATKFGISKRSYPHLDIKNLTREDAYSIYLSDFWLQGSMDKFHPAISFQVFDSAVNHGISTAIRLLQRAVGVADDGHIGPISIAKVNSMSLSDVIMLFNAERLEFWTKLSTWQTFGAGWARRAAHNLRYGAQDN